MPKLRILVLTSSTGGGHDARAEAFAEWCFQLYRHDVDVRIEQMLEESSVVNRTGVNMYNSIQRNAPWAHNVFYAAVEVLSYLNSHHVTFGNKYYVKVLEEYRPHLVFSVHDCLNRGYFQTARKILGPDRVRCATYCGEFSGGWGYSRNWIEPTVDMYFSRTRTANDYAIKKGIAPEKTRVRGYLMLPRSHIEVLGPADRRVYRSKRLGLDPDLFTVFLATGGNGANNHRDLLPALVKYADRVQAIVICGRNKQTYNELVHWRTVHPEFNCHIEGYSETVHLLMQASDAIVTRGGTTTCAKALHFQCPIIFNAFGGIMPQEELTWKFFRNGAASEKIERAEDFARIIDRWMEDAAVYAGVRENFLKLRYEEDPTILIDELVTLANEVAGVKVRRQPWPRPNGNGKALQAILSGS
ncbi:glycosyltransferase [Opitutus sp. ER46]|uniref:glycosyltransferase n=1 Tax=Opitutus sp. ER46 TaxID=2161864 RepID=UPI000D322A39|nr:glycosyltransferase [Opitutus sp. ER46]PTX97741.1 glycosyltransferase [Opitutus sp. ER46]